MTELLNENSLYTDATGRAAIVSNKQLAMDALCFGLLGFLGCYQLAQNRAFLKTYERTEGKLQLQSIGDANHDVSLSVKLAEEAGAIPQSAAMNVTKLLYKIKSKQVKGTLNEDLVRSLIKTCRISSNRPAGMIYNVVNQFETGAIGLGELAKKLYNLSKLPNFKAVSGEFRQLVMKGQYQELFAKLPTNNIQAQPVSATSTLTAPVDVQTPSAIPVLPKNSTDAVVSRKLTMTGFEGVSEDILAPLYDSLITTVSTTTAIFRDTVIKFCKKNNITNTIDPQSVASVVMNSLVKFMKNKATNNDWDYLKFTPAAFPKWMLQQTASWERTSKYAATLLWLYMYAHARKELLGGRYRTFNELMDKSFKPQPSYTQYVNVPFHDNTEAFLTKIIRPEVFWDNYKSDRNFAGTLQNLVNPIYTACSGRESATFPKLPMSLELWTVLSKTSNSYFNSQVLATFGQGYKDANFASILSVLLKLEHTNIAVTDKNGVFVVTTDIDYFKNSTDYNKLEALKSNGVVEFVNTLDAFGTMTDTVKRNTNASSTPGNFWRAIVSASQRAFGNTDIVRSEKFINWMVDEFKTGNLSPKLLVPDGFYNNDEAEKLLYNVMTELFMLKDYTVTFTNWCTLYNLVHYGQAANASDTNVIKTLDDIFKLHAGTFGDIDSGLRILRGFQQEDVVLLIVDAVKSNKIKLSSIATSSWTYFARSSIAVDDIKILARQLPDDKMKDVCDASPKWKSVLMIERASFRRQVFDNWKANTERNNNGGNLGGLTNFLNYQGGYSLDESLIPDDIKATVLNIVKSFAGNTSITYNDIDGRNPKNKIPSWIDKPLRAVLLDNTKSTVSMKTVTNADRLMTRADFNNYVDAIPIDKIATTLKTTTYSDSIAFSAILEKMAHNPSDYNVNTMLKLAYAMHVGYKAQSGSDRTKMIDKSQIDSAYTNLCEALNNLIGAGKYDEVNKVYDSLSFAPDLKTKILDWFRKSALLRNSLNSVKNDEIHALVDVDPKRMNQLMRFNNIKFPTSGIRVTKTTKLSDIAKLSGTFDLEPLKTSDENLDQKALDRRTAEFDVFNKYRHGNIGIKFLRSFNVAIPSQIEANKIWNEAHPNDTVMDPVFHGTGSVAATFVLRYGFAVISASDSSVVGRMLGNGIYFSNVLDKCGQYVSDSGYSRGLGRKGYVFQMKANLGKEGVDYKAQAAGLVSPEWCVFHPNDQLNIYKAHFVELVDKSQIDEIKQRAGLNEDFFKVEQFKEHLNESQTPETKGCVSYTFMDGTIPVSDSVVVDFEEFDPTEYGSHVTMAPSGLGPVIYIQVDDPTINEIYAVRYTVRFMSRGADLQRFQDLLAKRPVVPLNTSANTVENS